MKKIFINLILRSFFVYPILILLSFASVDGINSFAIENEEQIIIKNAPFVRPLRYANGARYCSSSSVKHGGEVFTLTNWHCCAVETDFGKSNRLVGRSVETILYVSDKHDLCVLTSSQKDSHLKLAQNETMRFDSVLMMGYPRGDELTPRSGYVLSVNKKTAVGYEEGLLTRPSTISSLLIFPGNSGSPIFNKDGDLVEVAYAGPDPVLHYAVSVPHSYVKEILDAVAKGERQTSITLEFKAFPFNVPTFRISPNFQCTLEEIELP